MRRQFVDSRNVGFVETEHGFRLVDGRGDFVLPERVADWPEAEAVKAPGRIRVWKQDFDRCDWCKGPADEVHHIVGGSARSDEYCNLISLCREHHELVQSSVKLLPNVLWLKWQVDRWGVDWKRLALLLGRHLPLPKRINRNARQE